MTEALFYHLERRALEDVLPGLVERSLARGWRALVRADSAERSDALDTLLWTYDDQSFLPHAQVGDGERWQGTATYAEGGRWSVSFRGVDEARTRAVLDTVKVRRWQAILRSVDRRSLDQTDSNDP